MCKVLVLLSTYNGERYLEEQLESLLKQKDVTVSILVRDDGSSDKTIEILEKYKTNGYLQWYSGKNLKPAKSFMNLVYSAPHSEYYAFCDQDDVWLEDKLAIAVKQMKKNNSEVPMLYYGRPRIVDAELNLHESPKTSSNRMLAYTSALINSNATGCTMVFNDSLRKKICEQHPEYVAMHDAWFHKVCLICKGNLIFDEDVHILYRQHGNNVIGISNSKIGRLKSHIRSFKNKECSRSRIILSLLKCYGSEMSKEDLELSTLVANYRKSFINRMKLLFCKKIKTDYIRRNVLFKLAVLLKVF